MKKNEKGKHFQRGPKRGQFKSKKDIRKAKLKKAHSKSKHPAHHVAKHSSAHGAKHMTKHGSKHGAKHKLKHGAKHTTRRHVVRTSRGPIIGLRFPMAWSDIRRQNPLEFYGLLFFTLVVVAGVVVGLYYLIKWLLNLNCGVEGNKVCPDGTCAEGLEPDKDEICRAKCSSEGQKPCTGKDCAIGLMLKDGVCVKATCGTTGQAPCADGNCLKGFVEQDGKCTQVCSVEGKAPCVGQPCKEGLSLQWIGGFCSAQADLNNALTVAGGVTLLITIVGIFIFVWGRLKSNKEREEGAAQSLATQVRDKINDRIVIASGTNMEGTFKLLKVALNGLATGSNGLSADERTIYLTALNNIIDNANAPLDYLGINQALQRAIPNYDESIWRGAYVDGIAKELLLPLASSSVTDQTSYEAWITANAPTAGIADPILRDEVDQRMQEVFDDKYKFEIKTLTAEEEAIKDSAEARSDELRRNAVDLIDLIGLPKALVDREKDLGVPGKKAQQLLLEGPAGTGKTMFVQSVLKQDPNALVLSFNAADLSKDIGADAARFEAMMKIARNERLAGRRVIVFLDEVDMLATSNNEDLKTQIQTAISTYPDVTVVANTNFPESVPAAILSRLTKVKVPRFKVADRKSFLTAKFAELGLNFGNESEAVINRLAKVDFGGREGTRAFQQIETYLNAGLEVTEEKIQRELALAVGESKQQRKRLGYVIDQAREGYYAMRHGLGLDLERRHVELKGKK